MGGEKTSRLTKSLLKTPISMRRLILARSSRLIREVKNTGIADTPPVSSKNCISTSAADSSSPGLKKQQHHFGAVDEASWWVPHPGTGIYYPKGHEWVMEDVPQGASSFPRPYWLRNSEGVERSDHNNAASNNLPHYDHPFLGI